MREPRPEKIPRWVFDKLPPSGARRGGDPSEYAFSRTLDTFVREALQNANDQSLSRGDGRAEVRFDLEELAGRELRDFRIALGWDELHRHLRGAAAIKSISKFRPFAEGSPVQDRLILMRVEDRHTSGLVGEESEGDSNFRALCRDSLFSHKETAAAGGSYGLGKSVYWSFSSHSTVIFHSCLHERGGPGRHRLIGRVELPSHAIDGKHYMGPGWFGEPQKVENGERAVSLWDGEALDLAKRLRIDRLPQITGTTILVVGFRDPTSEGSDELPALLDQICRSAAEFFWPAMHFPRPLRVLVGGQPVPVTETVAPFVTAWQQRSRAGARLEKPGDIASRKLQIHLPRRRTDKDGPEQLAECDLIVRLAEPRKQAHSPETHDNCVALFRGPGMIVKYLPVDPSGLMPRFHAILACGEGRAPEHPTASDKYAEAFLRSSEPPGHDDWSLSPRLKDDYVKGGGAKLTQLFDDVRKALRELLLAPTSEAQRGPELLQRRYPLGGVGDPKPSSGAGAFHFSGLEATFSDGRWCFAGTVEPATRGHAWTVTITLKMLGEDGSELDRLNIAEISLNNGSRGKAERTAEGTAVLSASNTVDGLAFLGLSEPLPDREQLCELGLEIAGELLAKGPA